MVIKAIFKRFYLISSIIIQLALFVLLVLAYISALFYLPMVVFDRVCQSLLLETFLGCCESLGPHSPVSSFPHHSVLFTFVDVF